ncbi:MAG: hypothetical protein JKY08_11465 [Flavobacteriaceae bacterium]|nr:hypothetical protein [Flavobacteriaceae bacterium]
MNGFATVLLRNSLSQKPQQQCRGFLHAGYTYIFGRLIISKKVSNTRRMNSFNQICYFAATNFRNKREQFGILLQDRLYHFYIIGRKGIVKARMRVEMFLETQEYTLEF